MRALAAAVRRSGPASCCSPALLASCLPLARRARASGPASAVSAECEADKGSSDQAASGSGGAGAAVAGAPFAGELGSGAAVGQPEGGGLVLEVAVLGVPNVGKSTLTNALVGRKVTIASPKVQTTRENVLGVCTRGRTQVAFVDTPGLISHTEGRRHGLARPLLTDARNAIVGADVVLAITDGRRNALDPLLAAVEASAASTATPSHGPAGPAAADPAGARTRHVFVINKIDVLGPRAQSEIAGDIAALVAANPSVAVDATFVVSALRGDGVDELREYLHGLARPGLWAFPAGQVTGHVLVKCVEERVREQLLHRLRMELPYTAFQRNVALVDHGDRVEIVQAVVVRSASQKQILIGRGGGVIRGIAEAAERDLCELLGRPVSLKLVATTANERQRVERRM